MIFDSKEIRITNEYKLSICFNGEFYQARIIHPPTPIWNEIGVGSTENEAISVLLSKLNRLQAA